MMLRRCLVRNTNIEIISFLNDLNARLERLEGWTSPHVFELGIIFASLNLSVQALQHFIARHQRLHGDQHLETGPLIVRALSDGLSSTLFETPGYDTKPLLSVITGEEDIFSRDTARLHDKLKLPPGAQSLYLCLLARLQSNEVLYVAWGNFINDLKISERKKFRKGFHDSYSVVQALLESARPEIACRFLEDIAMRSEHDLPFIETFSGLRTLLGSPVICKTLPTLIGHEQYRSILNAYLKDMEQRLGLKWQNASRGEQEGHVGLAPGPAWSVFHDQPLFTIDGDSAGYDSPSRLFCELGARGCSKSQSDLARLVDLLHEHDGNVYDVQPTSPYFRKENHRLRSARQSFPVVNFRWRPQHSPIEFSDSPLSQLTDFSQASDPVSLGLLRARKIIRGDPETGAECLHLMQLGYLDVQHGEDQPWMPSGYLVTLDRQYGNILAFFVGPNHGVVNPGPTPTDAPFGPVFALQSKRAGPGQRLPFNHYLRDLRGHYYLDVDPSPDLDTRE
ncbi:hypothetical protein N7512_001644 [Penicillium capsulatum]|nr:hypothetical protein N7512_001644 [Penicillium capsulatum]